ncbi:hypothetical protein ILUMI_04419 [Ignelater luminosus]|uniref:Tubulin epsilon and delta complex protein 1 domain-containing protein n=1 Tax=Ignelater luminosus TaxID=2038154 RepID=A0A8K0DEC9_IGNLU|nr:hypothetical protein ILUMI_04419 [Ignelater luminosus]
MGDIKITISNLCKHLNLIFDMKMKPEMFRLAKFNKSDDDIVKTFWILLSNMINLPSTDEIVLNVKRHFLNLKYKSLQFYALPEDMLNGSRELLLAFAYLVSQDYLNKYVKTMVSNSSLNPYYQPKIEDLQYKVENYTFNLKQIKSDNDFENALQWIEGRIKHNKKIMSEYQTCFEKFSIKLCRRNLMPHPEQLSVPAILALNSAEHAKTFLESTENVFKILENHERWLRTQSAFWDWMNSVLLERQKHSHVINPEKLDKFLAAIE